MWVFTYKIDSDSYITKFKLHLIAHKNLQSTKKHTYTVTITIQTFHTVMAIAAAFNLEVKSFNVINIFINIDLTVLILCKIPFIPKEYNKYNHKTYYLIVYKALYSLKVSANLW